MTEAVVFAGAAAPPEQGMPWLWSENQTTRRRLQRMLVVYTLFLSMDLLRAVGVAAGLVSLDTMLLLLAYDMGCMAVFFGLVRGGVTASWADPGATLPQVVLALLSLTLSYVLMDAGRGAVLPLMSLVLLAGMVQLPPRQIVLCGLGALLAMGLVAVVMSMLAVEGFQAEREGLNLIAGALMLPVLAWLAHRAQALRHAHAQQRALLRQALARLEGLATRDPLTGLSNHRHMLELLDTEGKRHARQGRVFCVAMLDLDFFRRLNEEQGRARGDEVLKQLATLSMGHLRASDVMARWGGEEFLILLPDTDLMGGLRSLERLREHLFTRLGFYKDGRWVPVSCSAGITRYRPGEPINQTLERAEQALQAAKAGGRDRVVSA